MKPSSGWFLGRTSEPLGVVFDGPEHRSAFAQAPVDDGVAGKEVRHGGWIEVSSWTQQNFLNYAPLRTKTSLYCSINFNLQNVFQSKKTLKFNSRSTFPALVVGLCVHILLAMFAESLKLLKKSYFVISIRDLLSELMLPHQRTSQRWTDWTQTDIEPDRPLPPQLAPKRSSENKREIK